MSNNNQLTMFKLWGDFDEDNDNDDGWNELEFLIMNENKDAMRPIGFKQSAEPMPVNRQQRRAAKKRKKG